MKPVTPAISVGLVLLGVLMLGSPLAVAQNNLLTRAEIYKLVNKAQLAPKGKSPRPAKLKDTLVPLDALQTAQQSLAELLFNEGSLARLGANTIFRFVPGTRSFQLQHGKLLAMIPPGQGSTTFLTPEAIAIVRGTALLVRHDATQQITTVGVLTNSLVGPVLVTNRQGQNLVRLQAGQQVAVTKGVVGTVEDFSLPALYESCDLTTGLATQTPNAIAPAPPLALQTFAVVQAETTTALANQSDQPPTVTSDPAACAAVPTVRPPDQPRGNVFDDLQEIIRVLPRFPRRPPRDIPRPQ